MAELARSLRSVSCAAFPAESPRASTCTRGYSHLRFPSDKFHSTSTMTNVFRTFLLLALLALGGEALAQPCHEGEEAETTVAEVSHSISSPKHHQPAEVAHCSNGACEDASATGSPHDCDQACSCCPGHCASALPTTVADTEFLIRNLSSTAYRPLDSSPAPESDIRPPIPA